jgi:hypothetical protein
MGGSQDYAARFEVHVTSGEPTVADLGQLFMQFAVSLSKGYPAADDKDLTADLAETWTGEVTSPDGTVYRIEERWFGGHDEYPQDGLNFRLPWSLETDTEHGPVDTAAVGRDIVMRVMQVEERIAEHHPRAAKDGELASLLNCIRDAAVPLTEE